MIIYFTGTGNSRYIAELMAAQLGDSTVDATKRIKEREHPEFASEKPYIFVAPTYAWRMPRVFREWIKACKWRGSNEAYFVLTCGGEIGAAGHYIEKFAKDMGFDYMGTASVVMPDNYIIMFPSTTEQEDQGMIANAKTSALALCERVESGQMFDPLKIKLVGRLESGIVNDCFYQYYIRAKKFYATDACISCGKCVESCMLNNITLSDGRPSWGKDCTHCMACIGKCPTAAIEYGQKTKGKRRYLFVGEK